MLQRARRAMFAVVVLLAGAAGRAGEEPPALKDRLDAIVKRQEEALGRYRTELAGKTTEEEQRPAVDRFHAEVHKNTTEVLELVRARPRDPSVVPALQFVVDTARTGPGDESRQALGILMAHTADPGMGALCGRIFYFAVEPAAETLIRAVLRDTPQRDDRALACFVLADYLHHKARMVQRVREDPAKLGRYVDDARRKATLRLIEQSDPQAIERESQALLERVIAEFADVKDGFDPRPLGAIAEGKLFAERDLAVGKVAPEIVGRDHEGREFRLGDFRGKVVLLTFSGNWCGPCVGYYPQERALIERMKDRPFVALSVNTDEKVETLKEAIAKGDIAWRCWWDGPEGPSGPITTRWGISMFPSVFVIDPSGVIRFKDVRDKEVERAVDLLTAEAEKR